MFIIKFNNMVKNKWLWGAFAIFIAAVFGLDFAFTGRSGRDSDSSSIGKLNGVNIDVNRHRVISEFLKFSNRNDREAASEREVWKNYAALLRAEEMGIKVSDRELFDVITSMGFLKDEAGVFDKNRYLYFLRSERLSEAAFQDILRCDLTLSALRSYVTTGANIAPSVTADRVHGLTDKYTISTVVVSNSHDAAATEVSPDDVKAYYDTHTEKYRVDEQRQAVYVTFKATDYLSEGEAISDDDALEYYDANISKYTVKGTNGVETVKEFETVRADVEKAIGEERSREAAAQAAEELADIFHDGDSSKVVNNDFVATVRALGFNVHTTKLFTAKSYPVKYAESPAFVSAVFDATLEDLASSVTEAIIASPNPGAESYVACLVTNVDTYIPAFDAVEKRVVADAKADKAQHDFEADETKVIETISAALEAGKSFADAAAEAGLVASTNIVFSHTDSNRKDLPFKSPREVARAMLQLSKGDFSPTPIAVPGGAMFFYVADREAGDETTLNAMMPHMRRAQSGEMADMLWKEWLEKNLLSMNPQPKVAWDAPDSSEEE